MLKIYNLICIKIKIWSNLTTKPYYHTNKYENYSKLFYAVHNNP